MSSGNEKNTEIRDPEFDVHLTWSITEIIRKIGPEKAIREYRKRCEAGAIIGCTLYKRLCEKWLLVALEEGDSAARSPAEDFLEAAGEDLYVKKVEELHREYPGGIRRSERLDLIDEFNHDLEKRVGRRIPIDPEDASEEDIKISKKIVEQMARGEKIKRPISLEPGKAVPPEKEIPPKPPKEKEIPKPEPVRAPIEPIIPVPEKPAAKPPELDLMKREIEERIAKMRAEKARGELKAGENSRTRSDKQSEYYPSDRDIDMIAEGISKLSREERIKIARSIIATMEPLVEKREEMVERAYTKVIEFEKEKGKIEYFSLEDIAKLPKEKRLELARKITRGEIALVKETSAAMRKNHSGVREDVDILTEPRDYSQWTFGDYEGLLPGMVSVEELEEMYEQVGASEVISESDKETLRSMIKLRIDEVKRFYIEWTAREVRGAK